MPKRYLVSTVTHSDAAVDEGIKRSLSELRTRLGMDVVFVSRFTAGRRLFTYVDADPRFSMLQPGMSDPLEQSWCNLIAQGEVPEVIPDAEPLIASGRVPFTDLKIGTHLSVPVKLADGSVYGTVCCFSEKVSETDLNQSVGLLRVIAADLALRIDSGTDPTSDEG